MKLESSVDFTRPRRLLVEPGKNPFKSSHLVYIYLDRDEQVCVPNVSYNLPPQMQSAVLRSRAEELKRRAADAMRDTFLSVKAREQIRDRYLARCEEMEAQAKIFDDQDLFMTWGYHSCGLPRPDREKLSRTRAALANWDATQHLRDAMIGQAESASDIEAWEAVQAQALYELQRAFFFDTSDINQADNCRRIAQADIRRIVLSLDQQQGSHDLAGAGAPDEAPCRERQRA